MEHKKAKNNQEEKRILKKQGKDKQPLGQPQGAQHLHHRGSRKRRESKKLEMYLEKLMKTSLIW